MPLQHTNGGRKPNQTNSNFKSEKLGNTSYISPAQKSGESTVRTDDNGTLRMVNSERQLLNSITGFQQMSNTLNKKHA